MKLRENYKQVDSAFERLFVKITRRRQVEERRMYEKMRRLKAFHLLSKLSGSKSITIAEICRVAVKSLRESFQNPEFACARMIIGNREFRTANYMETQWRNTAPVIVNDRVLGNIETCYIYERPGGEDIESMAGELSFLNEISEHLAPILRRTALEKEVSQQLEEHQ
jgi:hypothetical protein